MALGYLRFRALNLVGWLVRGVGLAGALALMPGCAFPPPADDQAAVAAYVEANDPYEPLNRGIFAFNQMLDDIVFRPAAKGYRFALPEGVRDGVRNALNNMDTPKILINDMLQGNLERAGESGQRLVMNTLGGLGGIVDVAAMDYDGELKPVEFHDEDFGQTLGVWGFGEGPYLMLPVLGPSNVRDLIGIAIGAVADPVTYLVPHDHRFEFSLGRRLAGGLDSRARVLDTLDEIERDSIDFYAAIRSLYRQRRRAEIANGVTEELPAPDLSLGPAPEISLQIDDDVEREPKAKTQVN